MMEAEGTYLVYDPYEGFKVVMNSGGAQMQLSSGCKTVDEALRAASQARNFGPVAIRIVPC